MTDRIDLDELADDTDEAESNGRSGDWLDGDHPGSASDPSSEGQPTSPRDATGSSSSGTSETPSPPTDQDTMGAIPHVPHPNKRKPAGIPVEGGGSGGGTAGGSNERTGGGEDAPTGATDAEGTPSHATSGPHGGDADDMTLAFTYESMLRFEDPAAVVADASRWADWIGIVGDVDAHVVNKFQRDRHVDVDFFNGSGTGPAERLADIGPNSMFFAERMVLVGLADEAWIAERAEWEFRPLETAAEKADWTLER